MKDQQIDLLRVGQLALSAADRDFSRGGNRFAKALEEMHYSTALPLEMCKEVIEQLAKQASQRAYEKDLNAIRGAVGELCFLQKKAEQDVMARLRLEARSGR